MHLNNSTLGDGTRSSTTHPTSVTLCSMLLVWSLLANVLVITVIYCNQNLKTNMNYLIVNMAVSDLLVPLVAMPWFISLNQPSEWLAMDGPFGNALCKLVPFLSHISPFVSSINLVVIAFQRYIAVVYPIRRQILSRKTKWIAISFPWIVATALFTPHFYTWRLMNKNGYTVCVYIWSRAFNLLTGPMIFLSTLSVVGFVIPLITIIILYTIMIRKLRNNLNSVRNLIEKEAIRSRQRKNRRIFRMIITIVVLFTICWCPIAVFQYLYLILPTSVWSKYLLLRIGLPIWYLWYSLSAINPCLYFMFLRDFRRGLKILCCRKTVSAIGLISGRTRTADGDTRTRYNLTSIPLQSRNINTRRPRTPGGDSNQDPTCTPPHINTTSV